MQELTKLTWLFKLVISIKNSNKLKKISTCYRQRDKVENQFRLKYRSLIDIIHIGNSKCGRN